MHWVLNLDGGPKRVNHAAICLSDKIYSFGGYSANEPPDEQDDFIDVHVLNTFTYRWKQLPTFPGEIISAIKPRSATISVPPMNHQQEGPSTSNNSEQQQQQRRRAQSDSDADNLQAHVLVHALPIFGDNNHPLNLHPISPSPHPANFEPRQRQISRSVREVAEAEEMQVDDNNTMARNDLHMLRQRMANIDADFSSEDEDSDFEYDENLSAISSDEDDDDGAMMDLDEEEMDDDDDAVDFLDEHPMLDLVQMARLRQHPEIPYKRYGHTVVAYKGHVYLWGGRNDKLGCSQTLHCYDPVGNSWSIVEPEGHCPPARDGHTAVVNGDTMYIFGGFEEPDHRFSQETYSFHFPTRTWAKLKTRGEPPQYRDFHAATILDDKMYVFGGRSDVTGQIHSGHDIYCDLLHFLDLRTFLWHTVETCGGHQPCGRRSHTMWSYNGAIYLFGGYQSNRNVHFNDFWRFDAATRKWTLLKPTGLGPSPRRRQCTIQAGTRLFLFGGTMPNPLKKGSLSDLGDLFVLDFSPSLATICSEAVLKHGLLASAERILPSILSRELHYMCTPNQISKSQMRSKLDTMRG